MSRITVNSVDLYFEEHGTGDEAILFVHPFLLSSAMWHDPFLCCLPREYRAFALDMRGHGRSRDVRSGCTVFQMADDIHDFAEQLGLEKFVYVGVSMGGAVGVQFALDHPETLRGLILMNPGLGSTVKGSYMWAPPMASCIAGNRWLLRMLFRSILTWPLPDRELENLLDDAVLVGKEAWLEYGNPHNRIEDLTGLGRLEAPTLVMTGGTDRVIPLTRQREIASAIPHARTMSFQSEGHAMVIESRVKVFDALFSFLAQTD